MQSTGQIYEPGKVAPTETVREGFDSSTSYFTKPNREELAYKVEQAVAEELQPPLRDISQSFAQGLTDMMYDASAAQGFYSRRDALEQFEKNFWKDAITRNKGILSKVAEDTGRSRERLYDKLRKLDLMDYRDHKHPERQTAIDDAVAVQEYLPAANVESTLSTALSGYQDIIQPSVYDTLQTKIKESAPSLAQKITDYMPTPTNRLNEIMEMTSGISNYREAKTVFERQVVYDALEAAGFDKKKAATYLGDSLRTLNRKIADLNVEEMINQSQSEQDTVIKIEEAITQSSDSQERPEGAVKEIERFQQLVQEYNAKRDMDRKRRSVKQTPDQVDDKDELKLAA